MSKPPNLLVSDAQATLNSASMRVSHVKIATDGSVVSYAICPGNQISTLLVCTVNGYRLAERQLVGSFLHSIPFELKYVCHGTLCQDFESTYVGICGNGFGSGSLQWRQRHCDYSAHILVLVTRIPNSKATES